MSQKEFRIELEIEADGRLLAEDNGLPGAPACVRSREAVPAIELTLPLLVPADRLEPRAVAP